MRPHDLRARAERWLADDPDPSTQAELRVLLDATDPETTDLADRFAGSLEFGTAGLRGVLGAGPNRMNRAVVARATWGLARELHASVPGAAERAVVVGGDARRMSRELSEDVACILAATGLRVLWMREPAPTPLIGFLVKRLRAAAGVVITASHNPPEYNGYKVYWENGAQIIPPIDQRIADAMQRAPAAREVPRPSLAALQERGLISDAPADAAGEYLRALSALCVHPGEGDRGFTIVYTPLHGVGDDLARRALAEAGFASVTSVPEQQAPDAAFPTVAYPNPEEPGAMALAFALGKGVGAELILANDPDADRLAAAVPADGGFVQLTGNQVGVLLGHYLLTERPASGPRAVIASIVSSPLLGRIAGDLGAHYEETLTGFKWIANRAVELERSGHEFVFGYEEALGYCVGSAVRDKDGISAALLLAEMTAVLRSRGRTLSDELGVIARRWGVFTSAQISVTRQGATGALAIRKAMQALRASPPARVADDPVVALTDYEAQVHRDLRTGVERAVELPASLVLALHLASGARLIARPSGTEPKAKIYVDVREGVAAGEPVEQAAARARQAMARLAAAFERLASF